MQLFSSIFLLALSLSSFAQIESVINFRGQNSEMIKIDQSINVVRPVPYQVPDTCYNQIPYQSYECHDETRYRQECRWIPESESCRTENERVCRNVTRTREECSRGPDRQVCHDVPGREICVERPTRQVCHTNPQGHESCTTVGGGQSCHTTGGGRECNSIPGERECRNVSYSDQECEYVPHRRCERIPGRNDCQNIPYSQEVCGNETRYRQEPYACQRTEYRDVTTPKRLIGQIQVHFLTNGLVEEFPLQVLVSAANQTFEKFESVVKLMSEPKVLVILKKKLVQAKESESEIAIQGEILVEVLEPNMVSPVFPDHLKTPVFNPGNNILTFVLEGGVSAQGAVEAIIMTNPLLGKKKTVAELKASYPSEKAVIKGANLELNLDGLIQKSLTKKNDVKIKLSAELSVQGVLLNSKKPEMFREYNLELKK